MIKFKQVCVFLILFIVVGCETPSDKIIEYSKKEFGEKFKKGELDVSKVFDFKWDTLYIFYPLVYPEDIQHDIGFEYRGEVVPDDTYLFLFVFNGEIVRKYSYGNILLSFDKKVKGLNSIKIAYNDALFIIEPSYKDHYNLSKVLK